MSRGWLGGGAAVWGVLSLSLLASDASPDVIVLAGVVAVLLSAALGAVRLGRAVTTPRWPAVGANPAMPIDPDRRIVRLQRDARNAIRSESTDLHARLSALAAGHPRPTPALQRLAAGPARRLGTARELDRILSDLEAR